MTTLDYDLLDAYVQLIVLGAYIDGELAEEERRVLIECINDYVDDPEERARLNEFARNLPRQLPCLIGDWRLQRVREIKALLKEPDHRRSAFGLVVHVTKAHRGIGLRETRLLLELMSELDIDESYARAVLRASTRPQQARAPEPHHP